MKTVRHLSLINNTGIALGTYCFDLFEAEFEVKEGSEYNRIKFKKLLRFSKCLARHSFPCLEIMTVKTMSWYLRNQDERSVASMKHGC